MPEGRFLEAGGATVRPTIKTTTKGLSQDEEYHLITVDGESFPKDVEDRDAEIAGFELGDGDSGLGPTAAEPTGSVAGDEAMAEAPVRARKAPKEPTEMERLQHEATHLPYT